MPGTLTATCKACHNAFEFTVKPHEDPNACGMRICRMDIQSLRGHQQWSELWYVSRGALYSLKGNAGEVLEEAKTEICYEAQVDIIAAATVC